MNTAENSLNKDSLVNIISCDSFNNLNEENQTKIIQVYENKPKIEQGVMGKIFGNNPASIPTYAVFIICLVLLLLCFIDFLYARFHQAALFSELWSLIIPVVSTGLGYIYGKAGK